MADDDFRVSNPKFIWDDPFSTFEHPDLELLENFKYPEDQLRATPLPKLEAFLDSNLVIVDDKPSFIKLLQTLRNQKEIALDFREGRSKNKNIIVICISTVTTDYMLDMTKIKQDIGLLSEIFLNPQILKIFGSKIHLNIFREQLCFYFINVIDLGLILNTCFNIQKLFKYIYARFAVNRNQFPDVNYNMRPFTKGTKHHCRAGIHHFIYIYNDFKNQIIAKNETLWLKMLNDCRVLCKQVLCGEDTDFLHLSWAEKQLREKHEIQLQFLQKLLEWRKRIAEEEKIEPEDVANRTTLLRLTCIDTYSKSYFRLRFASGYISRDFEKLLKSYQEIKAGVVSSNRHVYTRDVQQIQIVLSPTIKLEESKV